MQNCSGVRGDTWSAFRLCYTSKLVSVLAVVCICLSGTGPVLGREMRRETEDSPRESEDSPRETADSQRETLAPVIGDVEKRPKCSIVFLAHNKGTSMQRLTNQLFMNLPDTYVVKTGDPLQTVLRWLYDDQAIKAHPHLVYEQNGEVMHGFLDVVIPILPGLKAMATSRGCKMVVMTMFREPAAQYMEEYKTMKQGTETLLDYARRKPEVQLSRLTRLIDPLLKLRQENMCESSQLNCTLASKDLYRGLAHSVDYAINERLAALDLVGIHELFRETVTALDRMLGLEGRLVQLDINTPALEKLTPRGKHVRCEASSMTYSVFTHSVGHGITEADACLYNQYSVFEMLQLRKVAASAVRVYDKWRRLLGNINDIVGKSMFSPDATFSAEAVEKARAAAHYSPQSIGTRD